MIKVNTKTLQSTREALPSFLYGLQPESLQDLSWTDPTLGVSDSAWWQEVDKSQPLAEYQRYGGETLTVDPINKVVEVVRSIVPWTAEEIAQAETDKANRIKVEITTAVQQRLDNFARTRNYDSILSACTYSTSTNAQFAREGQYCVTARDNTWAKLYQIMAEVEAGTRLMPTSYADIESELPALVWPV